MCVQVSHHCQVCQAVKPRQGVAPGTMNFCAIPQDIFTSLCMDFVDLESVRSLDDQSYDCCLTIVCRLSGFVVAIPCLKQGLTAKKVAQLFLEKCVSFMGLPNEIVSDNDHLLSSAFFTTLCDLLGIEQHFSIIYRPKGNGRAEAAVKSVVSMLRICLTDSKSTWITVLPWVLFQINNLPGLLPRYSPFKIVFGRDPPYLGEIPSMNLTHVSVDCEQWVTSLENMRKAVQQHSFEYTTGYPHNFWSNIRVANTKMGKRFGSETGNPASITPSWSHYGLDHVR